MSKHGIKEYQASELRGAENYGDYLDHIEVRYSQDRGGQVLKTALWKADGTGDCLLDGNLLLVLWERNDTYLFQDHRSYFIDLRPTTIDGFDIEVPPVQVEMNWSLYPKEEQI